MNRSFFNAWTIAVLISVISGLSISAVLAQQVGQDAEGIKLSISPLPISVTATPGQTITQQLQVRNVGTKTETLVPNLLTFSADKVTGSLILHKPTPQDIYLQWVSFSAKQVILKPLEWGTITMTIAVPKTAAYGYYFAVSWARQQTKESNTSATSLIGSVAQLVLLEVPAPGTKRLLNVEVFKADHEWYEFLPVTFTIKIHNSGNIHASPYGNIFINDNRKKVVDSLQVNSERGIILPATGRIFTITWKKGFPVYTIKEENGKAVLDVNDIPEKQLTWKLSNAEWWRFGHYHASLVMAYNRNGQDVPLLAETSFWVFPWRLILLLIAIPTIPAVLVYFIMSRMLKRKAAK